MRCMLCYVMMLPGIQKFWVSEPSASDDRLIIFKNVPMWFCANTQCRECAKPVLQPDTHRHVIALTTAVAPVYRHEAEVFDYKTQA